MDIGACNYDLGLFGVCAKNFLSRELNMYFFGTKNICKNNLFGQNDVSK